MTPNDGNSNDDGASDRDVAEIDAGVDARQAPAGATRVKKSCDIPKPKFLSRRRLMGQRMTPQMRALFEEDYGDELFMADALRPRTRADCVNVPRPCPYVGCPNHLYLDVDRDGSIRLNFPHLEPRDMPAESSCLADLVEAARGEGMTLDQIGAVLNLTRERVRQISVRVLLALRRHLIARGYSAEDIAIHLGVEGDGGWTFPVGGG